MTPLTRKCGLGKIYRKPYTRKLKSDKKVRVPGSCIRSQSPYGSSLKVSNSKKHMHGYRLSKRALRSCPSGYIKRNAFIRRSKTKSGKPSYVPEHCIRNVGAPGKGLRGATAKKPGIGALRKGELSKFGYEHVTSMSSEDRQAALEKAIKEFGSLSVWHKLNAVHVYTRRLSPATSRIFKEDMNWVKGKYGLKAF